jgi:hypothetical protein
MAGGHHAASPCCTHRRCGRWRTAIGTRRGGIGQQSHLRGMKAEPNELEKQLANEFAKLVKAGHDPEQVALTALDMACGALSAARGHLWSFVFQFCCAAQAAFRCGRVSPHAEGAHAATRSHRAARWRGGGVAGRSARAGARAVYRSADAIC